MINSFKILPLILFATINAVNAQNGGLKFFGPHGDLGFISFSQEVLNEYCSEFDCQAIETFFTRLENEIENGIDDQKARETVKERALSDYHLQESERLLWLMEPSAHFRLKRRSEPRRGAFRYRKTGLEANILKEASYESFLKVSQALGVIDSVQYYVLSLETKDATELSWSLRDYRNSLRSIATRRHTELQDEAFSLLNSSKMRRKIPALKEHTPRQRLYLKFNSIQIQKMSKVLANGISAMNAARASLYIDYAGDGSWDRQERLSQQEKYRMGLKLILRDYFRTINSRYFSGEKPMLIDFLSAAVETGEISKEVLKEIINIEELNLVPPGFIKRHLHALKSLARIGLLSVPVAGPYLAVGMVLVEAYTEGKKGHEKISPDHLF